MLPSELAVVHGMIGRSVAMQALFRRVERVAQIDVPVLVVGESGSGKELVARAIQRLLPYHKSPSVLATIPGFVLLPQRREQSLCQRNSVKGEV
jgi:DNA-binding NtrC family response regulator